MDGVAGRDELVGAAGEAGEIVAEGALGTLPEGDGMPTELEGCPVVLVGAVGCAGEAGELVADGELGKFPDGEGAPTELEGCPVVLVGAAGEAGEIVAEGALGTLPEEDGMPMELEGCPVVLDDTAGEDVALTDEGFPAAELPEPLGVLRGAGIVLTRTTGDPVPAAFPTGVELENPLIVGEPTADAGVFLGLDVLGAVTPMPAEALEALAGLDVMLFPAA